MALTGELPEIPISHRGLVQCGWHPNHSMPMMGVPNLLHRSRRRCLADIFESWSSATSVNTSVCPVDHSCTLTQTVGLRTTAEKRRPPCSTLASMLLAAGVQASAGHPFAQATFYQEGFF